MSQREEYEDRSFLGGVLGMPVVQEIKDILQMTWITLKIIMPLTLIVLLALMTASPDGVMPRAKFDGESRWIDLGAMPVLALAFAISGHPSRFQPWRWSGVLTGFCLVSMFYMLLYGAGFAMGFFCMILCAAGIIRLSLPWLKRAGRALGRNEDVQDMGMMLWMLGAALFVIFLAIFSFPKLETDYEPEP